MWTTCVRTRLFLRSSQEHQQLPAELQPLRQLADQHLVDLLHLALGLLPERLLRLLGLSPQPLLLLLLRSPLGLLFLGQLAVWCGVV